MTITESLNDLARLTDAIADERQTGSLAQALAISDRLRQKPSAPADLATLDFFTANTWSALRSCNRTGSESTWDWEQPELEHVIACSRRASPKE